MSRSDSPFIPPATTASPADLDDTAQSLLQVDQRTLDSLPLQEVEAVDLVLRTLAGCPILMHGPQQSDLYVRADLGSLQQPRVWDAMAQIVHRLDFASHVSSLLARWLMSGSGE